MKKGLKIALIIVGVGILSGLGTVYYIFNKPARNVEGEKPSFTMEAKALFDEYNTDEEAGNLKFGDKVIQVKGKIVEMTNENAAVSFVLNDGMEGVNCALDSMEIVDKKAEIAKIKVGDEISLKGKCDGFDMIMGVVLTRCYIVKEEKE